LGLTVGAFSGGRLASTILLGVLAGLLTYQQMFLGSGIILILAGLMYSLAGAANSKWLLFFARIGQGLGAGSLGIVRAYFAETYDEHSRTRIMAVVAGVQYAGFALFPGVGDLLDIIVSKLGWTLSVLNAYTIPSWVMIILIATSLVMLVFWFKEPPHLKRFKLKDLVPFYKPWMAKGGMIGRSIQRAFGFGPKVVTDMEMVDLDESSQSQLRNLPSLSPSVPSSSSSSNLQPHLHNFSMQQQQQQQHQFQQGKSSDEDDPVEILDLESQSGLDDAKSDFSSAESSSPVPSSSSSIDPTQPSLSLSSSQQLTPPPSQPKQKFTLVTMIWLSFLIINFLIRVVLGTVEVLGATLYDGVTQKYITAPDTTYSTSSGAFYTILGVFGVGVVSALALFAKKIPDQVPFLTSLIALLFGSLVLIGDIATMSLARFSIGAALIYTVGYPLAQSVVVSIFSKIPASARNQAVSMSWIGSAGSIGRILGPIVVGAIYQKSGAAAVFIFNSAVSALIIVISLATLYFMSKLPKN